MVRTDRPADGPLVLLLHGMDGIGAVWQGVIDALPGGWRAVAPDLGGHGSAPRLSRYGFEELAGDLLDRLSPQLDGAPVLVAGHSLGGVVGMVLAERAARAGLDVRGVLALSCKTDWPEADVAAAARVADKGVVPFDDEDAARARFLRVSGLDGLLDPSQVGDGVAPLGEGRWRLAVDPEVHRVAGLEVESVFAAAGRARLLVATGEHDPMAPPSRLGLVAPATRVIAGAGHNVHVEQPGAIVALLQELWAMP
jgi:pimeloyl-ACP methyl ester carboxylesterase